MCYSAATVLGKGVEHNWAGRFLDADIQQEGYLEIWMTGLRYFLKELKANFEDVERV